MKPNLPLLKETVSPIFRVASKRRIAAVVCAVFATASVAVSAQQLVEEVEIEKIVVAAATTDSAAPHRVIVTTKMMGDPGLNTLMIGDELASVRSNRQLKNAPYSAVAVTEKVQVLRDGNELRSGSSSRLYRDAAGRTRDETVNANGEVTAVRISDTVEAGTSYALKPSSKTATKISLGGALTQGLSGMDPLIQLKVNEALGRLKVSDGGSVTSTSGSGSLGDPKITVTRIEGAGGANALVQGKTSEVLVMKGPTDGAAVGSGRSKVVVLRGDGPGGIDTSKLDPRISEMLAGAVRDGSYAKAAVKTSLGNRDFSGVRAEGTLSSYVIPANAIGNQQPITVTDESWKSTDLNLVVYRKRSDPREGDTIYRLENIQRVEQPLSLFTVPADYKLIEPSISMSRTPQTK